MPLGIDVVRGARCDADLDLIFEHLFNAYHDYGDAPDVAFERAVGRIREIGDDMAGLGNVPFQGIFEPLILEGLRYVAKGRAVFCFLVDESREEAQVLGIFFGGQDLRRHMHERIKELAHGQPGNGDDPDA